MEEKFEINIKWGFLEEFYFNYSGSNKIARLLDLEKIVDNEVDEGSAAEQLLMEIVESIGSTDFKEVQRVAREQLAINLIEAYNLALDNFRAAHYA